MNDHSPRTKSSRRRIVTIGAAAIVTVGLVCGVAAAADAATGATPTPSATSTPKPTHSAGTRSHARGLESELRLILHSGKNLGDEAQAMAVTIVDNHPKLYAKLPSALKTDLTTLKNAPESDRTADATKIEKTALSGGYGSKIEALAKRIQSHLSESHSGSKSTSTPHTSAP